MCLADAITGRLPFGWPEVWDALSSLSALAVVGLTFPLVRFNRKVVEEMERERLDRTKPKFILYFFEEEGSIELAVQNIGGPAYNVSFSFDPPLINSRDEDVGQSAMLQSVWPIVGPDQSFSVRFARQASYFDIQYYRGLRPDGFAATITHDEVGTDVPFSTDQIYLSLKPLSLLPHPSKIIVVDHSKKAWKWHKRTSDDERDYDSMLTGLTPLVPGLSKLHPSQVVEQRGWSCLSEHHGEASEVLCVRTSGPLARTAIYSKSWDSAPAFVYLLEKILVLEGKLVASK